VIESHVDPLRGSLATILVREGTLHIGDYFVCGTEYGRIRAMRDDRGGIIKEAGPARPVEILGLRGSPSAGETTAPGLLGMTRSGSLKNQQIKKVTMRPRKESPVKPINAKIAVANADAPIIPYPGFAIGKAVKCIGSDQKYFSIHAFACYPDSIHNILNILLIYIKTL